MQIIAEGQTWTRVDAETFANERGHEICKQDVKDEMRMIRWADREIKRWARKALAGDMDAAALCSEAAEQRISAMWGVRVHEALWG